MQFTTPFTWNVTMIDKGRKGPIFNTHRNNCHTGKLNKKLLLLVDSIKRFSFINVDVDQNIIHILYF